MKKIILLLLPVVLLTLAFIEKKPVTVTGIVSDEKGKPISNASVTEKSLRKGVQTNVDGTYSITVSSENATLVFSSVGYQTNQQKVKGRNIINVMLKNSASALQEVVVIGYGAKRDYRSTSSNLTGAISGKVAVVQISNGSYDIIIDDKESNTEGYDNITENAFLKPANRPMRRRI